MYSDPTFILNMIRSIPVLSLVRVIMVEREIVTHRFPLRKSTNRTPPINIGRSSDWRAKALLKMSRYKGRASLKSNEAKFPHHVDMMVPESGFGSQLNEMHKWHEAHGISEHTWPEPARERTRYYSMALC